MGQVILGGYIRRSYTQGTAKAKLTNPTPPHVILPASPAGPRTIHRRGSPGPGSGRSHALKLYISSTPQPAQTPAAIPVRRSQYELVAKEHRTTTARTRVSGPPQVLDGSAVHGVAQNGTSTADVRANSTAPKTIAPVSTAGRTWGVGAGGAETE
jgi:hypothetical protein